MWKVVGLVVFLCNALLAGAWVRDADTTKDFEPETVVVVALFVAACTVPFELGLIELLGQIFLSKSFVKL